MIYKGKKTIVRTIRQGDPDWHMQDGFVQWARAGFEINTACPTGYKQVIQECISNGWLKPVAHVKDYELMLDRLYE